MKKPLASVCRIVQKGNTVVFDELNSYILNKKTGEKTRIHQEHGTCVINVGYLIPSEDHIRGGGHVPSVTDASGSAGFTRPAP